MPPHPLAAPPVRYLDRTTLTQITTRVLLTGLSALTGAVPGPGSGVMVFLRSIKVASLAALASILPVIARTRAIAA